MTRRRIVLSCLWLALALATLLVLILTAASRETVVAVALAWLGGIVSDRLHADVRSRRA